MGISGLHHAAYRCKDAAETVAFYRDFLDLDFNIAVAENTVPSTGEWSPHIHIFLQMADGSFVAFFELPEDKGGILDEETPKWVQHLAFKVKDRETLVAYKEHLEANGVEVLGVTDHSLFYSIYFFDPNGHRIELACNDPKIAEMAVKAAAVKDEMLEEWTRTKRAPRQAACPPPW